MLSAIEPNDARIRFGLPAFVGLAAFWVFVPALWGDFVNLDDHVNFVENEMYRGFSLRQLAWMLSHAEGHYQPLTWLSHALDFSIWGMNPAGYHLHNLLLHSANAVIFHRVGLLLLRAARPPEGRREELSVQFAAATGAILFAVHPLRVESVVWITERRDVLFLLFALLSVKAYLRAQKPGSSPVRRARLIRRSLWLFAFSLLSKAMAMTLPALLLVIDCYPLRRFAHGRQWRPVLYEKLPYLAIAFAAIAAQIVAQRRIGALATTSGYLLSDSLSQPAMRLVFYLGKLLWPSDLHPMYLLPFDRNPFAAPFVLAALIVVALTAVLVVLARRWPGPLVAWAAFVIALSPVLGLIQVGSHFAADRNSYLASLPLSVLVAAGLYLHWASVKRVWVSAIPVALLTLLLMHFSFLQSEHWRDSESLWVHTVEVDPDNHFAHYNLGLAYRERGDMEASARHYTESIRHSERVAEVFRRRRLEGGASPLGSADALDGFDLVEIHPTHSKAYQNRGLLKMYEGDLSGAIEDFTAAIELRPGRAVSYLARSEAYARSGSAGEATADRKRGEALLRRGTSASHGP